MPWLVGKVGKIPKRMYRVPIREVRDKTISPSPGCKKPHSTPKQPGGNQRPHCFPHSRKSLQAYSDLLSCKWCWLFCGQRHPFLRLSLLHNGYLSWCPELSLLLLTKAWAPITGNSITPVFPSCHTLATLKPLLNLSPRSKLLLWNTTAQS